MRSTRSATSARRAQGEESRQRLIDAATGLIAERGYAATSVGEICRAAGVAKTALYWHFDSKEGLLAAVLEQLGHGWIEDLQKRAYLGSEPLDRLNGLVEGWRDLIERQPEQLRLLLFLQLEHGEASRGIRDTLRSLLSRAEAVIVAAIEDTCGTRDIPDADLLAHSLISLLQGLASRAAVMDDPDDLARSLDEFRRTALILVGMRLPEPVRDELELRLGLDPRSD